MTRSTTYIMQYLTANYKRRYFLTKWSSKNTDVEVVIGDQVGPIKGAVGSSDWRNGHPDKIFIDTRSNKDLSTLIDTIAHEYRHLMQSPQLYFWYRVRKRAGYWNHPLEVDARQFASDQVLCLSADKTLQSIAQSEGLSLT